MLFTFLHSAFNRFGFGIRSRIKWKRRNYVEKNEPKETLFRERENAEVFSQREKKMLGEYNLQFLYTHSTRYRYLEILTYLECIKTFFPGKENGIPYKEVRWLDVGSKNFSYVESIAQFLCKHCDDYFLQGIELDAYRVYRDFYSRYDYAQFYIHHLPNVQFEAGDVLQHSGEYDIISSFLPFIFVEPTLKWGLPQLHYAPTLILDHLVSLLKPGGYLIVMNQGIDEYEQQARLFAQINKEKEILAVEWSGELPESFLQYKHKRYGWRCRKISDLGTNM